MILLRNFSSVLRASLVVTGFCVASGAWAVDYSRDIKPILSENCFACHGFDEKGRKGKLRLDVAASAYAERNGLFRIKPGDLANSEVWARIISTDPEEVMPPPKEHRRSNGQSKRACSHRWALGRRVAVEPRFLPISRPQQRRDGRSTCL